MTASCKQLFFCKPPVEGLVKTRLAKTIGAERACAAYREMLRRVVERFPPEDVILYSSQAENLELLRELLPEYTDVRVQEGADLGRRMANALAETSREFPGPALLAGTDIPDYSPTQANRALTLLRTHDLVLGPTPDGGYYVVGLGAKVGPRLASGPDVSANFLTEFFANIPWSTPEVLSLQRKRARDMNATLGELEELPDLDDFSDLVARRKAGDEALARFIPDIRLIIPVYNEAENLPATLNPLQASGYFQEIICADNGSQDGSPDIARNLGARVTHEPELGYGATCLRALADIRERGGCEVVVFMDADGADDPGALPDLIEPILRGKSDFTLGARLPELAEPGALKFQARFGNLLAVILMRLMHGFSFRDLGPYRAISWRALETLDMDDRNFGWTIQMQIRAVRRALRVAEIPVRYRRRRAGYSKVTSNPRAILKAGRVIFGAIFKELGRKKNS